MTTTVTRRTAFAGAAALAAVPTGASALTKVKPTQIGTLWAEAESLKETLAVHRAAIAQAAANGGISGWMRLGGEANRLGAARYERLVAILNATPRSEADLAVMARVVQDAEFRNGAHGFAAEKLADATVRMFAAAA
jgi:hypothetical protein